MVMSRHAVSLGLVAALWHGWGLARAVGESPNAALTVRSDVWCPYNCEPGSDRPGFLIEMLRDVFGKAGYRVDYQLMSWNRALSEGRKGAHAVVVGANAGEAEGFVYPAVEQGMMVSCLYTKASAKWRYDGVESLRGITLGALRDGKYAPEVDTYIARNARDERRISFAGGEDPMVVLVKKLLAGRIDAFISDRAVATHTLSQMGKAPVVSEVGCVSAGEPIYIVFSAANPKATEWARLMSDSMAPMRRDGRLEAILSRYGLRPWAPVTRPKAPQR